MLRILLTLFAMVLFGCGADAQTRSGNMPRTPGTPARSSTMTPTTSPIVAPGAIPMVGATGNSLGTIFLYTGSLSPITNTSLGSIAVCPTTAVTSSATTPATSTVGTTGSNVLVVSFHRLDSFGRAAADHFSVRHINDGRHVQSCDNHKRCDFTAQHRGFDADQLPGRQHGALAGPFQHGSYPEFQRRNHSVRCHCTRAESSNRRSCADSVAADFVDNALSRDIDNDGNIQFGDA